MMGKLTSLLSIILSFSLLFSGCSRGKTAALSADTSEIKVIKIKALIDTGAQGWVWKEKEITKQADVDRVLNKLKSIRYSEIDQTAVYGFGLIVEYKADKDFIYVFSGDRVNINGKYYGITIKEDEGMRKLYEALDYKEKPSKP
jgi:hypothetical protein